MNTNTGEVRDMTATDLAAMKQRERQLWVPISDTQADYVRQQGAESLRESTPDQHLGKRDFKSKYGCSRMEYALRGIA